MISQDHYHPNLPNNPKISRNWLHTSNTNHKHYKKRYKNDTIGYAFKQEKSNYYKDKYSSDVLSKIFQNIQLQKEILLIHIKELYMGKNSIE